MDPHLIYYVAAYSDYSDSPLCCYRNLACVLEFQLRHATQCSSPSFTQLEVSSGASLKDKRCFTLTTVVKMRLFNDTLAFKYVILNLNFCCFVAVRDYCRTSVAGTAFQELKKSGVASTSGSQQH